MNKLKNREKQQRYVKRYPEKVKARKRLYYQKNKEKWYKYNKQRRLKLRFQILQRDNFTCQYCGRKAPDVILQIDHKYPKSKGGKLIKDNLITACVDCNQGKKDIILTI